MTEKRDNYRPTSDLDIRAAALRATHERLKAMDAAGKPTVNLFGAVLKEEKAKFKAYGIYLAEKGTCPVLTWENLKTAVDDHAKTKNK